MFAANTAATWYVRNPIGVTEFYELSNLERCVLL